jgi:hypothetical protein
MIFPLDCRSGVGCADRTRQSIKCAAALDGKFGVPSGFLLIDGSIKNMPAKVDRKY